MLKGRSGPGGLLDRRGAGHQARSQPQARLPGDRDLLSRLRPVGSQIAVARQACGWPPCMLSTACERGENLGAPGSPAASSRKSSIALPSSPTRTIPRRPEAPAEAAIRMASTPATLPVPPYFDGEAISYLGTVGIGTKMRTMERAASTRPRPRRSSRAVRLHRRRMATRRRGWRRSSWRRAFAYGSYPISTHSTAASPRDRPEEARGDAADPAVCSDERAVGSSTTDPQRGANEGRPRADDDRSPSLVGPAEDALRRIESGCPISRVNAARRMVGRAGRGPVISCNARGVSRQGTKAFCKLA
jgi:hypothetical protein